MIRRSILYVLAVLSVLSTGSPVYAGYTVHTGQLQPEYVTVNGPYGPELWLNPERPTIKPPTYGAEICRPANYSIYAADPARRVKVFQDSAGSATDAELFAACPQLRDQRATQIRIEGDKRLKALATPYMAGERETWAVQMKEAEEYLFDPVNTQTPMLTAMATARGIQVGELVGLVWENVVLFRQYSGLILGKQQRLLDEIDAATTIDSLLAVGWGN